MSIDADPHKTRQLSWPIYLILVWAILTLLFWVLNPAATEGFSAGQRLIFWALHTGLPLALLQLAQTVLSRGGWVSRWPALAQVFLGGVIGGLLFAPVATLLDPLFPDPDGDGPEAFLSALSSEVLSILPAVVLVWIVVNAPRLVQLGRAPSETKDAKRPGFWPKVPAALGDDLVSLSAELHYTRVRTALGETLVLYPFGKAVEELESSDGLQVHRSHWLAFAHVTEVVRKREQAEVRLDTGDTLPVSRRYRAALMAGLEAADLGRVIRA